MTAPPRSGWEELAVMSRLVEAINEQHWADTIAWDHAAAVATMLPSVRIGTAITVTSGALPITGDYHLWPDWNLWHAVGLCEQRGDGPDGIAWSGSAAGGRADSGYPGGLGLSVDFWNEFAPQAGVTVTNGALATPGEQIRVARAGSHDGTRMGGWSSWGSGCIQREEAKP